jgi:hypothetical protein
MIRPVSFGTEPFHPEFIVALEQFPIFPQYFSFANLRPGSVRLIGASINLSSRLPVFRRSNGRKHNPVKQSGDKFAGEHSKCAAFRCAIVQGALSKP